VLGIGDDAAVMAVPKGQQLVVTMDTLVAGRHFPGNTLPEDIGYKSLAVNVSDLVAMAATPFYFLLSITMPNADEDFLRGFSQGLFEAANEFAIPLVGGDTCKGPLSISIQASGLVDEGRFVTRRGAKPGDKIMLSGVVGAAALGLDSMQTKLRLNASQQAFCENALNRPQPRVDLIELLKKYAHSAIDISDGLIADIGHILQQSAVGAILDKYKIPAYEALADYQRYDYALNGGDDYQVAFTVAPDIFAELLQVAQQSGITLYEIGEITDSGYLMKEGATMRDLANFRGFDHFGS